MTAGEAAGERAAAFLVSPAPWGLPWPSVVQPLPPSPSRTGLGMACVPDERFPAEIPYLWKVPGLRGQVRSIQGSRGRTQQMPTEVVCAWHSRAGAGGRICIEHRSFWV